MKATRTVIEPQKDFSLQFSELWQYRELFYFFTWRDIKVKYKQAVLGVLWAILQPLALMLLFTFVFSKIFNVDTNGLPYPVFVLCGLLLWNLFYASVSHSAQSMIENASIIKKIYFPRLIIPISAILVALFDFLMALIVFAAICIFYKTGLNLWALLFIPVSVLIVIVAATGAGCLLSAMNVKYRDFRYVVPFLLQLLFFASQVIYPLHSLEQSGWKNILFMNPVNPAIELLRSSFTQHPPNWNAIIIGSTSALILFFFGIIYFRKNEKWFADIA